MLKTIHGERNSAHQLIGLISSASRCVDAVVDGHGAAEVHSFGLQVHRPPTRLIQWSWATDDLEFIQSIPSSVLGPRCSTRRLPFPPERNTLVVDSRWCWRWDCGSPLAGGYFVSDPTAIALTAPGIVWDPEMFGQESLTYDELSALRALVSGRSDQSAAASLCISVRTYRRRVASGIRSLGASSRFQAAVLARARGLL